MSLPAQTGDLPAAPGGGRPPARACDGRHLDGPERVYESVLDAVGETPLIRLTGTAVAAALELARELTREHLVVVVLPDSGRGYLSTALDDGWLRARGFLEDAPAGTVRALLDAGGAWPALPTVADDVPLGALRDR